METGRSYDTLRLRTVVIILTSIAVVFSYASPLDRFGESRDYISGKPFDTWQHLARIDEIEREKSALDRWLIENAGDTNVPSVAVMVVLRDAVVYRQAIRGSFNASYGVASFTKMFTALSILQLADRGRLSLDDPVSKFLPAPPETPGIEGPPITIRQVLTHTSGLVDAATIGAVDGGVPVVLPVQRYPAGYRFVYSNLGYVMLGDIVGKASGMPLGRYITLNILAPLEMRDSIAEDSMQGSGGLRCSLEDLSRLVSMLLNKGTYKGKEIVSERMFSEIFRETVELPPSRFKEFRGIGWRVWTVDGRPYSMNHAALWDNTGGWIQVFPTLKAGYIFLSNPPDFDREEFYGFYRKLKYRLLRLTGKLSDIDLDPVNFQVSALETGALQRLAGRYVNLRSGRVVDISLSFSGSLVAYRPDTGERFDLVHSSGYTFVYVFPDQTEKGYAFDFIYRKRILKGLAIMDGYYTRL